MTLECPNWGTIAVSYRSWQETAVEPIIVPIMDRASTSVWIWVAEMNFVRNLDVAIRSIPNPDTNVIGPVMPAALAALGRCFSLAIVDYATAQTPPSASSWTLAAGLAGAPTAISPAP